jgi:hypothetical protein
MSFGFIFKNGRFKVSPASIRKAFLFSVYSLVLAIFVFWALIGIKFAFDDAKVIIADYQAMWGKPIDEKRGVITGGDFYEYLQFCDRALPPGAGVDFVFSDSLYYAFPEWLPIKARYYLFPKYHDPKSPYKLVFGPGAEAKIDKGKRYQLIAKFKDGEVILKEGK